MHIIANHPLRGFGDSREEYREDLLGPSILSWTCFSLQSLSCFADEEAAGNLSWQAEWGQTYTY